MIIDLSKKTEIEKLNFIINFYRINSLVKKAQTLKSAIERYKGPNTIKYARVQEEALNEICNELNVFMITKSTSDWSDEKKKVERQYILEAIQAYFAASPKEGGLGIQLPAKEFNNG